MAKLNTVIRRVNSAWRTVLVRGLAPTFGSVVVNEFPKSGGTWIGQMVAQSLRMRFPRNQVPGLNGVVLHGHYLDVSERLRHVIVWRDGRDVMVSWYFHCLVENERDNARLVRRVTRDLGIKDIADVATHLPTFIEYAFTRIHHPRFTWAGFVRRWSQSQTAISVRYEDVRRDPSGELRRIVWQLTGLELCEDRSVRIADDFSFARLAGRSPGAEVQSSFMRKGIVGDWRNVFSASARQVFAHYAGAELRRLGYESDDRWIRSVE